MQKDYIGTEKCGSDTPKNTGETLYLGSTSSESFKRERWVKLRCLYNSRGRCFIPCYYTFLYTYTIKPPAMLVVPLTALALDKKTSNDIISVGPKPHYI